MPEKIHIFNGANMDIDLLPSSEAKWKIDTCPWNKDEGVETHKCAIKNTSICKYFRGIKQWDKVRCAYKKQSVHP